MATKLISGVKFSSLPSSYIRPKSERPNMREVGAGNDIPVVDMGCQDRSLIIKQIGDACANYGFFQVIVINSSLYTSLINLSLIR